jgi:hypothetical protein
MSDAIQKYVVPGIETVGGAASELFAPGNPAGIAAMTSGATGLVGGAAGGGATGSTAPNASNANNSWNTSFNPTANPYGISSGTDPAGGGIMGAVASLAPLAGQGIGMLGKAAQPQGQTSNNAIPRPATPAQAMSPPVAPPRTPVAGNVGSPGVATPAAMAKPAAATPQLNALQVYQNFLRQIGAA